MQADFGKLWNVITCAQVQFAMQPQNRWQRARNQPEIIEVGMKQPSVDMRLDEPAIDRVRAAARQEKWIAQVEKPSHSQRRFRITQPDNAAINNFSNSSFNIKQLAGY